MFVILNIIFLEGEVHTMRVSRMSIAACAGALTLLASPALASAHIHADPDTAPVGGYANLDFGVPHGCDGSATTKVTFDIPKAFAKVTPNVNPNWTIDTTKDGEHTTKVVYTAKTPLPADQKDVLTLSVKVDKEAKEGDMVLIPATQTCQQGEVKWESADHEADHPAPMVTLTAAEEEGHHSHSGHGDHADHTDHADHAGADHKDAEQHDASPLAGWGLGLGALGAITGISALIVALKKNKAPKPAVKPAESIATK